MPIIVAGLVPHAGVVLVHRHVVLAVGKALVRMELATLCQLIGELLPLGGARTGQFLLLPKAATERVCLCVCMGVVVLVRDSFDRRKVCDVF